MATQQDGTDHRIEHDSMGEVRVPAWAKWRAQTQRAVENFPISGTPIERELIGALAAIKGAAAAVNADLGVLDAEGYPVAGTTRLWTDAPAPDLRPVAGRACPECGHPALIRRDGCDFCTACGHTGACG